MKNSNSSPSSRLGDPAGIHYARTWIVLSYLMLAIGLAGCLLDPQVQPPSKIAGLILGLGWGIWYWLIIVKRSFYDRTSLVMVLSFMAGMAVSVVLSWIHPAFLLITFGFYGITFAVLTLQWAIPLVVMLSFALAWRIAGLNGGVSIDSLPIFASFGLSAFFSVLLGLYINGIIKSNREKQKMIEDLEAARSELAKAERQAGMLEERQRLAGEIHDTLAQGFTSVVMHLEAAEQALDANPEAARGYIDQARQTARQSLSEARRFLWALRPDVVAREPLAQALQRIGQRWSEESEIPLHLETAGTQRPLPAPVDATFLRAAQEALINTRKYSKATQVNLTLTYMEDEVVLDVQDDGVGFDPAKAPLQAGMDHGYGLAALRERAAQLGGSIEVESAPGEGTTVVISLPVSGNGQV
jgi:signal transduction histidine kinase